MQSKYVLKQFLTHSMIFFELIVSIYLVLPKLIIYCICIAILHYNISICPPHDSTYLYFHFHAIIALHYFLLLISYNCSFFLFFSFWLTFILVKLEDVPNQLFEKHAVYELSPGPFGCVSKKINPTEELPHMWILHLKPSRSYPPLLPSFFSAATLSLLSRGISKSFFFNYKQILFECETNIMGKKFW